MVELLERGAVMEKRGRDDLQTKDQYIEVWEDLVSIKDLFLSIVITALITMLGYFLAPAEEPLPLFFGLTGAIIGFTISSFIFKPKRTIEIKDGDNDGD